MKKITQTGGNYPKKKILELVKTFGLFVDYDQWDVKGKGWLRIKSSLCKEAGCVVIYKDHLEANAHQEKEFAEKAFQDFLMKVGAVEFKKEFNNLLTIE